MAGDRKPSELSVIVRAKDLCRYVMVVTKKTPKHYRFSFVTRLHNLSLDVVAELYLANEVFVPRENGREAYLKRLEHQRRAMTDARLLAFVAEMAAEENALLNRQYLLIAQQVAVVLNLLGAWMRSDRERFGYR